MQEMSSKKLLISGIHNPNQTSEITNFEAIKELVQADDHYATVKNRIAVLKAHEQRNMKKIQYQKNKISQILKVRDDNANQKQKVFCPDIQNKLIKQERSVQIEKVRDKNQSIKEHQRQKMDELRMEMTKYKIDQYMQSRQKRIQNQRKINCNRQENWQVKKRKRNQVVDMEQKSKDLILEYISRKNNSIHESIVAQKNGYISRKMRREDQIEKISEMELKMIKKHSESQVAYKEMKNKLDSMLGQIRKENRVNKQKMKSVFCEKSPDTSFYPNII